MEKSRRIVLKPGHRVGPCEIIELIGHGGMGDVYRARHLALGKQVAVKILAAGFAEKFEYVEGFLREAKLAAKLEDAHIVGIYDVGSDAGSHYIVMQLAKGQSLRERLRQGRLEVGQALQIIEQIASGLSVAHEAGIVHRDIKPHNVILSEEDGGLKILDFGLAHFEQTLRDPAGGGEIVGSVAFMAPEQSDYGAVDARADIYALGITAFQCLTGTLPFGSEDSGGTFEIMARQQFELPAAPSLLNSAVPLTVSRFVLRMIEKLPQNRYQNVQEVLDELRLLRRHSLPAAPWPWDKRPLNPPALVGGGDTAEKMRQALLRQREHHKAGNLLTPLCMLASESGMSWREAGEATGPADALTVTPQGSGTAVPLSKVGEHGAETFLYRERFHLTWGAPSQAGGAPTLGAVRVAGQKPLDAMEAQYLYDLLEALPAWPGTLALSLAPDYAVAAQDVRWVVDVYNIAGSKNAKLTLTVGSTQNHDTFVRLGLDQHIELLLELEQLSGLSGPSARSAMPAHAAGQPEVKTSWLAEAGTMHGMDRLHPAQRALAATLGRHLRRGELDQASIIWRQLSREVPAEREEIVRPLREELFGELFSKGMVSFEIGEFSQAESLFNLLLDIDPGRHEGHYGKGMVFKKQGKLDYASAFLTQAILAAPDQAELFYHRAIVRSRMGDDRGALRDLNMAIEHNPRHANSYYNRSLLLRHMARPDLARRDMKIAQRLNPELRNAKNMRLKSVKPKHGANVPAGVA